MPRRILKLCLKYAILWAVVLLLLCLTAGMTMCAITEEYILIIFFPGQEALMTGIKKHADAYISAIVGKHADDERIIAWDVCNEPFCYGDNKTVTDFIYPYEAEWLRTQYKQCKEAGAIQPVSFSPPRINIGQIREFDDISDIYMIHPYFGYCDKDFETLTADDCAGLLAETLEIAKRNR